MYQFKSKVKSLIQIDIQIEREKGKEVDRQIDRQMLVYNVVKHVFLSEIQETILFTQNTKFNIFFQQDENK